ncbi:MAG: hypothetical protein K2N83_02575 [Eubacterium sp.]|nr:hypothetical protein [Eubacterium sp.]
MKRIISAILALTVIVCACTSVDFFAFAGFNKQSIQASIMEMGTQTDNVNSEKFDEIEVKFKNVIEAIKKGYCSLDESINIFKFKITQDELKRIVMYLSVNQGFYYVNTAFSLYELGGYVYNYLPDYTMTAEEIEKYNAQIEAVIAETAENARKLNTDIEKLIYIHNFIVDNIEYDEQKDSSKNNDIYGALVLKKTMCIGYAQAFNCIAKRTGFESYIVTSEELAHAWNLILLDGAYYFIDCTWDDPTFPEPTLTSDPVSGYGRYLHFMCSEKLLLENEYHSSDWVVNGCSVTGLAVSTAYDDFFWRDYESLMRYSNGSWYHDYGYAEDNIKHSRDVQFSIDKIKFTDNRNYTISTERTISTYWKVGAGYYLSFESALQNINDSIYYMTADGIFRLEDNGKKNGKDDLLVFENNRNDNIYDFKIDVEAGTFTVAFGKTEEYSEGNAVEITYKIADYICKAQKHQYERVLAVPTEDMNGKLVYTCNTCGAQLTQVIYCLSEMEKLYKYSQNSNKNDTNYNAAVDYNCDGVIDEKDWNLIKQKYDEYSFV